MDITIYDYFYRHAVEFWAAATAPAVVRRSSTRSLVRLFSTDCRRATTTLQVDDEEEWDLYWTDTSVSIERIMKLEVHQKINHFHGMLEICRKKSMARNLQRMAKMFPDEYDFFPTTYILPNDLHDLVADVEASGKAQTYILKPDAGCQGAPACRWFLPFVIAQRISYCTVLSEGAFCRSHVVNWRRRLTTPALHRNASRRQGHPPDPGRQQGQASKGGRCKELRCCHAYYQKAWPCLCRGCLLQPLATSI